MCIFKGVFCFCIKMYPHYQFTSFTLYLQNFFLFYVMFTFAGFEPLQMRNRIKNVENSYRLMVKSTKSVCTKRRLIMKKVLSVILAMAMVSGLTACGGSENTDGGLENAFNGTITVISREDGSGTRGAFVELTGVEKKNEAGEKEDFTTVEAVIASKTDAVLTNVAGDEMAIGYISMGSMNDTVKAVKIDSVEATTENIKNGSYSIARPFNVATKENPSEVTADFISFMVSAQGQQIAGGSYITVDDAAAEYTAAGLSGKITISGSSSVSPLVEKMAEAYKELNPDVEIEHTTTDSTGGMNDAANGVSDIGMASRELKDSEKQQLSGTTIAMDGIAVIVNKANPTENLTVEQIKTIYTGEVTEWEELA